MWKKHGHGRLHFAKADEAMEELLLGQNFSELFEWEGDISFASDFSDKDWFKYLERSLIRSKKRLLLQAINAFGRSLPIKTLKYQGSRAPKRCQRKRKVSMNTLKGLKISSKGPMRT